MKTKILLIFSVLATHTAMAQKPDLSKVSSKNTWFKVGLNAGVPLDPADNKLSTFVLGLDASVQFLETKASGIGIKSGYSHYFPAAANPNAIGELPLAVMYRFYPKSKGFFTGLDVGYSFIMNSPNTKGGFMGRPHVGYHGNNWNIFAYYNVVLIEELNQNDLQSVGISLTRNIRLKKGKKK